MRLCYAQLYWVFSRYPSSPSPFPSLFDPLDWVAHVFWRSSIEIIHQYQNKTILSLNRIWTSVIFQLSQSRETLCRELHISSDISLHNLNLIFQPHCESREYSISIQFFVFDFIEFTQAPLTLQLALSTSTRLIPPVQLPHGPLHQVFIFYDRNNVCRRRSHRLLR